MQKIIAVVGMHRSGTSAMTRALGYLGVGLGDTFIEAMPEVNAKGFWEDAEFNRINISLLNHLGRDWLSLAKISPACFGDEDLEQLAIQAEHLVSKRLTANGIFAFKDPRTVILLPFWKRVFEYAQMNVSYLIAVRNPKSVAESLGKRNGFEPVRSNYLWLRHMVEALRGTVGYRRSWVDYDALLEKPIPELRRIAVELGLNAPLKLAEDEFAGSFLDHELRHSHHVEDNSAVTPASALYAAITETMKSEGSMEDAQLNEALRAAEAFLDASDPLLRYVDQLEKVVAERAQDGDLPCVPTLRASFAVSGQGQLEKPESSQRLPRRRWLDWLRDTFRHAEERNR